MIKYQMLIKEIDYLSEDPVLSGQKFALVSIVGPTMKQKCDVWGMKVRGVADSLERAKKQSEQLLKIDSDYDIYTVEVGKFFPLVVEPSDITDVEYQNEALNKLIKGYLENKELANQHWHERKQELIRQAALEGKNQEDVIAKVEHPVAVLQRIKNYESKLAELQEQMNNLQTDVEMSRNKFENVYTDDERKLAFDELESEIKRALPEQSELSVSDIKKELSNLQTGSSSGSEESKLEKLYRVEREREMETNPSQYLKDEFEKLKGELSVEDLNKYINSKFKDSPLNDLA